MHGGWVGDGDGDGDCDGDGDGELMSRNEGGAPWCSEGE